MEDFPLPSNMSEELRKSLSKLYKDSKDAVENTDFKFGSLLIGGTTDDNYNKDLKGIFFNPTDFNFKSFPNYWGDKENLDFFVPSKFQQDENTDGRV